MRKTVEYTFVDLNGYSKGKSIDEILDEMISGKPFMELLQDPTFQETSKSLIESTNGNTISDTSFYSSLPMSGRVLEATT